MKAMIFAAGLGTRLRPLTNDKPKALVEVNGMSLLEINIRRLIHFGFREIIINIHHFGDLILEFLEKNKGFGIRIEISDERDLLLNTGGGLKKAASFFEDGNPFLVCNTDILTDLDLKAFYDFHIKNKAIATLAVRNRRTSRYLLFNEKNNELVGWMNRKTGELKWSRFEEVVVNWAFSGIHVIEPKIFDFMPQEAVFSIIDVYLLVSKHHSILGYLHNENIWLDVGKHEELEKAKGIIDRILI